MTNGRPASKSPGRTPPFILVGLLVLLCVLAYNYWTLSTKNADLTAITERLQLEAKSVSAAHDSVQKSLEEAQEKLRVTEGNLDHVRQILKEKEGELENLRNDMSKLQTEQTKCTEDLAKCDADLESQGQNLETAAAEKKTLEEQIAGLKSQNQCELEQCLPPIRKIMSVVAKTVDVQLLMKNLDNAQLDSKLILGNPGDGQNPNVQPAPNDGNVNVQPSQNENLNADMKNQPVNPPLDKNPSQESEKKADQLVGKTESTGFTKPKVSSSPVEAGSARPLVFQPDEKQSVGKAQMGKDGKEIVDAPPAEVVKQNVDDDLKVEEKVTSSEAVDGLDTEEWAKSTEVPKKEGK